MIILSHKSHSWISLWTVGHFVSDSAPIEFIFYTKHLTHPQALFSSCDCFQCFFHLYIFTTRVGPRLFFLAARLIRDEDTYGEVRALCAVLVLHQDAVLARVRRVYAGDGESGELARLELEDAVVVGRDLSVVLQPGDLWHGVARDVAGEIEGLVRGQRWYY